MMYNPRNLIHSKRFAVLCFAAVVSFFSLMFATQSVRPQAGDDNGASSTGGIAEGLTRQPRSAVGVDIATRPCAAGASESAETGAAGLTSEASRRRHCIRAVSPARGAAVGPADSG